MSPLVGHQKKYCLLASTWIPFGVLKTGGKNWVFSPQNWITWSWWLNPSVCLRRISIPKISKFGFNLFYFGIVCQPYLEKAQFKIKTDLTTASWWSLRICVPARSLISRIPRGLNSCAWCSMINYNYMQSTGLKIRLSSFPIIWQQPQTFRECPTNPSPPCHSDKYGMTEWPLFSVHQEQEKISNPITPIN